VAGGERDSKHRVFVASILSIVVAKGKRQEATDIARLEADDEKFGTWPVLT